VGRRLSRHLHHRGERHIRQCRLEPRHPTICSGQQHAHFTGIPLKIAANVSSADHAYFEQEIEPLLDDPQIEFLGAVNERGKQEVLSQALALLLPISWPEPFGMIFIEALACGTPVLTCPYGAVPELLEDGVTGYICGTNEELAERVHQVAGISRSGCRDYVRRHFDARYGVAVCGSLQLGALPRHRSSVS
jgi:glycosyltransferase involved in cell wall biosynthesis